VQGKIHERKGRSGAGELMKWFFGSQTKIFSAGADTVEL
jgi:hypothetical protein